MSLTSKESYPHKTRYYNSPITKKQEFSIPIERIILLIRKSSNNVNYIPECFCCRKEKVLGRVLHQVSRLLGWKVYYCEKCKIDCNFERRKCTRTRNMKKLHLIHTVVALKLRLPTNIQIKLRNNKG